MMNRSGHESSIQLAFRHVIDQRCRSAGQDGQLDPWKLMRVLGHKCGQSQSGRGLEHSDPQVALGSSVLFDLIGALLEQLTYLLYVGKQALSGFTWFDTAAMSDE